jgi:site-specific recombinase XerD
MTVPLPADLVDTWTVWQTARSLSKRTVTERVAIVRRMASACASPPHAVTSGQLIEWLAHEHWTARTRRTYHSALSAWFGWLQQQGHRAESPMAMVGNPRCPRSEPRPITDAELRRLLSTPMRTRTRAMILLAAFAGLRVHEIAKVRGEDVDLRARTILVTGKGNVTKTLPLHRMIAEHGVLMPGSGWWFPSGDGHQRRESVGETMKLAMVRAGIPGGTAHRIRHWYGTALVASGVDLRTTQELLRHASLTSTQIYTQISDQRRVDGIDRLGIGAA